MKAVFFDVKVRDSVEVEVVLKKKTDKGRCMIFGKTDDGRRLPKFIKQEDYDGVFKSVPDKEAPDAAPKKRCGCKKK